MGSCMEHSFLNLGTLAEMCLRVVHRLVPSLLRDLAAIFGLVESKLDVLVSELHLRDPFDKS